MNIIEMIKRVVRRVIVVSVNKDTNDTQTIRVEYFGKTINVDLFNSYGVASNPPKDSMGIMFEVEGQTDNRIAMVGTPTGIRIRELKAGEVVIGNFTNGNVVKFLEGKLEIIATTPMDIDVTGDANITVSGVTNITSTGAVNIDSPDVNMTGDLTVDGTITGTTEVVGGGINLSDHTHEGSLTAGTGAQSDTGEPN